MPRARNDGSWCGEGPRNAVPAGAGGTTIAAEVPDNATIPGTLCLRADVLHDALRSLPAVAPQRVAPSELLGTGRDAWAKA